MGVPILRGGRLLGVLAVQNRSRRNYTEDEVEALQTVAMVLAEVAASGDLPRWTDAADAADLAGSPPRMSGAILSAGLAIRQVVLHEPRTYILSIAGERTGRAAWRARGT